MSDRPFVERDDRYLAPSFRGVGVSRVILDDHVTLHVGSDALVIETPFEITDGSTTLHVVPGDAEQLHGAATLLHATCRSVELRKNGALHVEFADERRLTVGSPKALVSWQVVVRGRSRAVCRPGAVLSFSG